MATPTDKNFRTKIAKVRRAYLDANGLASFSELEKRFGISRQTISKYAKQEGWDTAIARTREKTIEKVSERASDTHADEILQFLRGVQKLCNLKLFEMTPDGKECVRDEHGNLMPNTALSPGQLHSLVKAAECHLRSYHLATGRSTENLGVHAHVTGEMHHSHEMKGCIAEIIERISNSDDGAPDLQAKLYDLGRAYQALAEAADNAF